jgi:transcriptional regulator with XRE-family HTH domain
LAERPIPELLTFSRNLRHLRESAGLSQQDLAEQAGLDRTYVSNLERGIGNPSLMKMASLSTVLSTSVVDLLTPQSPPNATQSSESHTTDTAEVVREIVAVLRKSGVAY